MIYVYRRASSTSARALSEALPNGRRLRNLNRVSFSPGDVLVCWGDVPGGVMPTRIRILNDATINSKFRDAEILRAAGVPTIEVSRTRPTMLRLTAPAPVDPVVALLSRAQTLAGELSEMTIPVPVGRPAPLIRGVDQLFQAVSDLRLGLSRPAPAPIPPTPVPTDGWIPRTNDHVGGEDLLDGLEASEADYWAKKETFTNEYRVHSFMERSIRAGIKAPRDGWQIGGAVANFDDRRSIAHPWVRSWDGGWRIRYDGVSSKKRHREIAHAAVKALGLTFGAVDIGEKADRSLVVLEVNRAPGLEGGTVQAYADAIMRWIEGGS